MRLRAAGHVAVCIIALAYACPLWAQTTAPAPSVDSLQRENASLHQQLEELKAEVAALKARLSPAASVTLTPSAPPKPAAEPAEKVYTTFRAMIDDMPKELWPNPHDGWDKFNRDPAAEYVARNMQGKWIHLRDINKTAGHVQKAYHGNWTLSIGFPAEKFNFHGVNVSAGGDYGSSIGVTLKLSDEVAKQFDKSKTPLLFEIKAQIAHANLQSNAGPHQACISVSLQNVVILKPDFAATP